MIETLSGTYIARFVVFYDEIGLCAQRTQLVGLGFIVNTL
jgi:hypothetical protein